MWWTEEERMLASCWWTHALSFSNTLKFMALVSELWLHMLLLNSLFPAFSRNIIYSVHPTPPLPEPTAFFSCFLHVVKWTKIIAQLLVCVYPERCYVQQAFTHWICGENGHAIPISIYMSLWSTSSRVWSIGFIVDLTVSKSAVTLSCLKIACALAADRTLTCENPFGT